VFELPDNLLPILDDYRALLGEVDVWFDRCQQQLGQELVQCRRGCSDCCRGLFDITLIEAALLQQGVVALPAAAQQEVLARSRARLPELQLRWPQFESPYLLNLLPDDAWQAMPEDDPTPCPLLDANGDCLVYAHRPMTCRLHGLPNIDLAGESFSDDYCTRNLVGVDPRQLPELRWEFRRLFEDELRLFQHFAFSLGSRPLHELDTFIPTALLIDFVGTSWPEVVRGLY